MEIRGGTAVMMLALGLVGCDSGFTEADVEQAKQSIRSEYEKRPQLTVVDVQMIKESPRKLVGFVKIKPKGVPSSLGAYGVITKNCSATWGEYNKYIWQCD